MSDKKQNESIIFGIVAASISGYFLINNLPNMDFSFKMGIIFLVLLIGTGTAEKARLDKESKEAIIKMSKK